MLLHDAVNTTFSKLRDADTVPAPSTTARPEG